MRGKATTSSLPFPISGITPAYAGKSRTLLRCVLLRWDHPRVCGEKCMSRCLHRLGARITPAYAGKRSAWPSVLRRQRDHPRVCGEKLPVRRAAAGRAGSPPRMRGKVAAISAYNAAPGITPAYAGKRVVKNMKNTAYRDHPRVCGEKLRKTAVSVRELGSPPRMRGKVGARGIFRFGPGITPAYAGKSHATVRCAESCWDHPRVCGEKIPKNRFRSGKRGSPPRMRGKVLCFRQVRQSGGITPAYAGKRH